MTEASTMKPPSSRFSTFRVQDAPRLENTDLMRVAEAMSESPEWVAGELTQAAPGLDAGSVARVVFRQGGTDPFSLVYVWFKPDYLLFRHSHDVDCVYYVLSGEATLGNRVVRAGEGFFVPAGHAYGYKAGPDGVEILEFRHADSFDLKVRENNPQRWRRIVEMCVANQERWAADSVAPVER